MNTLFYLNNYRTSVTDDKLAIVILAKLYRDGPKTEEELKTQVESPDDELRRKITKLYRANFLQIIYPDKWATTDLSVEVLAHLGIAQAAAKSLLAAQGLPQTDLVFLNACVEAKSKIDFHWSKQQTVLLQNLSRITEVLRERLGKSEIDRQRIIYAIVVGLDPDIQHLGEKAYCDSVFDKQEKIRAKLWGSFETEWKKHTVVKCSQAIKDVQISNEFLFHGARPAESDDWTTFSIAWARVLNALMTEVGDGPLQSGSRVTEDATEKIWDSLKQRMPDIEDLSFRFLWTTGKLKQKIEAVDDKRSILQRMLLGILRRQNELQNRAQCFNLPNLANEMSELDAQSENASLIVPLLIHFRSELRAGEYDKLLEKQKEAICELLEDVSRAFYERLITASAPKEGED